MAVHDVFDRCRRICVHFMPHRIVLWHNWCVLFAWCGNGCWCFWGGMVVGSSAQMGSQESAINVHANCSVSVGFRVSGNELGNRRQWSRSWMVGFCQGFVLGSSHTGSHSFEFWVSSVRYHQGLGEHAMNRMPSEDLLEVFLLQN